MESLQPEDVLYSGAGVDQYLTFMLDNEEYGIDILKVQDIRGWEQATRIPNTRDFMLGVINLRGSVVPIVDLRKRFELSDTVFSKITVMILVKVMHNDSPRTIGIVVDSVSEVYTIADENLNPAPDIGGAIGSSFVKGLATVDDKMIILLDIDRLINVGVLEDIDAVGEQGTL
jgi:purine-binding chemotaxis protein CheW